MNTLVFMLQLLVEGSPVLILIFSIGIWVGKNNSRLLYACGWGLIWCIWCVISTYLYEEDSFAKIYSLTERSFIYAWPGIIGWFIFALVGVMSARFKGGSNGVSGNDYFDEGGFSPSEERAFREAEHIKKVKRELNR